MRRRAYLGIRADLRERLEARDGGEHLIDDPVQGGRLQVEPQGGRLRAASLPDSCSCGRKTSWPAAHSALASAAFQSRSAAENSGPAKYSFIAAVSPPDPQVEARIKRPPGQMASGVFVVSVT